MDEADNGYLRRSNLPHLSKRAAGQKNWKYVLRTIDGGRMARSQALSRSNPQRVQKLATKKQRGEKMLTTLLSLLGGGLGGLLRFVPEILKLFTDVKDRDHEYRMTQLQLEIDKGRSEQALDLVHAQGDVALQSGEMQAYVEAIKGQSTVTGVAWVDGLNASVRPVITYWWMLIFSAYKGSTIYAYCQDWKGLEGFVSVLWTSQDAGVLSMILGFWFVDRAIRKQQEK